MPRRSSAVPANAIESLSVSLLSEYEHNARDHDEDQIALIAKSITDHGFTVPIIVDENSVIVAGHGRYRAAISLGMGSVPCVVVRGWSEEKKRFYRINDNAIAERATWNRDKLDYELGDLIDLGYDIDGLAMVAGMDYGAEPLPEYEPSVAPSFDDRPVESGDFERATDNATSFASNPVQTEARVAVLCPHCGAEFQVRRDEL